MSRGLIIFGGGVGCMHVWWGVGVGCGGGVKHSTSVMGFKGKWGTHSSRSTAGGGWGYDTLR